MSTGDQYVPTAADVWAGALDERDATIRELQAELTRIRKLGLDAFDRTERLASEAEALREQLAAANAKIGPTECALCASKLVSVRGRPTCLNCTSSMDANVGYDEAATNAAVRAQVTAAEGCREDAIAEVCALREQLEAATRERDEARATTILAVSGVSAVDALKAMTAERDEWKAKADAAVSRVAALEAALREVERVAEDWRHPDKLRNMADADVIAGNALSGGTSALDVHDAALREEIAREVESHAEDVDSMHWRQAHRIIAQRIVAGVDVLAALDAAKGG